MTTEQTPPAGGEPVDPIEPDPVAVPDPAPPGRPEVDERAARIVDLGQRRADKEAAAQGLVRADEGDAETVEHHPDRPGLPVDPPEPAGNVWELLDQRRVKTPGWVTNGAERRVQARRLVANLGY